MAKLFESRLPQSVMDGIRCELEFRVNFVISGQVERDRMFLFSFKLNKWDSVDAEQNNAPSANSTVHDEPTEIWLGVSAEEFIFKDICWILARLEWNRKQELMFFNFFEVLECEEGNYSLKIEKELGLMEVWRYQRRI